MTLTAEKLRERLRYDPETGVFTWLRPRSRNIKVGDVAGWVPPGGYSQIHVGGGLYKAHRLAWLYVHGVWPSCHIDHINCDPSDNRISNLREATNAENIRNQRRKCNNTTGRKGVFWHRRAGKYMAQIMVNGRSVYLGLHPTIEDAAAAYEDASQKYFGEFARVA